MGWNEGIKLGLTAYENAMARQQQERTDKRAEERFAMDKDRITRENAWQDEERGRVRRDWGVTDKLNTEIDAYREGALKDLRQPWAESNWQAQQGLAPRTAPSYELDGYDFRSAQAPPPYAPAQGLEPAYIKRQREALAGQVSVAGRDRGAIAAAVEKDRSLEMNNTSAQINSYVLNADPTQLAELASKVTLDKRNKYEIKVDTKTGMSTVVHENKNVELTRDQLGKFMAASYRLKQGDMTAAGDIEAIDTKLTGIVKDSLATASTLANTANDVNNKNKDLEIKSNTQANQDAHWTRSDANQAANNSAQAAHWTRSDANQAAHYATAGKTQRGAPVQLVNAKGDTGLFYLDKTNAGGMVEMPAGWRFPSQKAGTDVIKGEDGSSFIVDSRTKRPLGRYAANGDLVPVGVDKWDDKEVAKAWGLKGVSREPGQDSETGVVSFQYFDEKDPSRPGLTSPEAVLQRRAEEDKLRKALPGLRPSSNSSGQAPVFYSNLNPGAMPVAARGLAGPVAASRAGSEDADRVELRYKISSKMPLTPDEKRRARIYGFPSN
jgi:hypothetical protein